MKAGKLRHRVTIQSKTTTRNERGINRETWSALHSSVPAEIVTLSGRELEQARQLVGTATTAVRIRFYANVTKECRIVFGSRVLTIGHIDNVDQRDIELVLTCSEET